MSRLDTWLEEHKHLDGQHNQKKHGFRGGTTMGNAAQNAKQADEDVMDSHGFTKSKSGDWVRSIPKSEQDNLSYMGGVRKFERIMQSSDGKTFYVTRPSGASQKFSSVDEAVKSLDRPGQMNRHSINYPKHEVHFMVGDNKMRISNSLHSFVTTREYKAFLKKNKLDEKKARTSVREETGGLPTNITEFDYPTLEAAKAGMK